VPEEDLSAFAERMRSPSPPLSKADAGSYLPQTYIHLPAQGRVDTKISRTPSPVPMTLTSQTRTPEECDGPGPEKSADASVKVKLPNVLRTENPSGTARKKFRSKKVKPIVSTEIVVNK
jgi:hypothetical protein